MSSFSEVGNVVRLSSDETQSCVCGEALRGEGLDKAINHYLEVHGYQLLHVGQETTRDMDGNIWHNTVAILGR